MKLPLDTVARYTAGRTDRAGDVEVEGYSIDSRTTRPGDLFIAIRGPRVDGHDFVADAAKAGARAALVSREVDRPENFPLVRVDSTLDALHSLAREVRRRWGRTLIGVTGSAGKTTTKDLIVAVLAKEKRVLGSSGNFNNTYGMPLCLLGVEPGHDIAVLEMGMSAAGEIRGLAAIAEPSEGVVTNVGAAHLENFRSVDEIADAKAELIAGLVGDRRAYLNNGDPRVARMADRFDGEVVTYGVGVGADFEAGRIEQHGLEETSFRVRHLGQDIVFHMSLLGTHSVANAAAAISVGVTHGLEWESIQAAIREFPAARMRGAAIRFREGFTVIDDSYNSNPAALVGMMRILAAASDFRRRVLVAADMLELGPESERLHAECGAEAARGGIDLVIGVGPSARHLLEGAKSAGFGANALFHAANAEDAAEMLASMIEPGDLVLVKGSRGMHLERMVDALRHSFPGVEV